MVGRAGAKSAAEASVPKTSLRSTKSPYANIMVCFDAKTLDMMLLSNHVGDLTDSVLS